MQDWFKIKFTYRSTEGRNIFETQKQRVPDAVREFNGFLSEKLGFNGRLIWQDNTRRNSRRRS